MAATSGEVFVKIFDIVFANIIIGPLTVCYWKGTWTLLDLYLFPNDAKLSAWVTLAISFVISLPFYFFQNKLLNAAPKKTILYTLVSRIYVYFSAFSSLSHWRGVWHLIDEYTGKEWLSYTLCIILGLLALGLLRGLRTAAAPPFIVITDTKRDNFFLIPTMLNAQEKGHLWFLLDTLITVVMLHSVIVVIWRGFWVCLDNNIYPDNKPLSAAICLCVGYFLSFCIFTSERLFVYLSKKCKDNVVLRACVENTYAVIIISSAVFIWRGIWKMNELYLLDRQQLSNWLSHSIGYVLLTLMHASLSLPVRGYVKDFSKEHGEGIRIPIQYLLNVYPGALQICSRKVDKDPKEDEPQSKF